jgi:hypothetical protein
MPTQSIDLETVTEANFNGTAVEQINLNGTGIWTKPSQGFTYPSYTIQSVSASYYSPAYTIVVYGGSYNTHDLSINVNATFTRVSVPDGVSVALADGFYITHQANGSDVLHANQSAYSCINETIQIPTRILADIDGSLPVPDTQRTSQILSNYYGQGRNMLYPSSVALNSPRKISQVISSNSYRLSRQESNTSITAGDITSLSNYMNNYNDFENITACKIATRPTSSSPWVLDAPSTETVTQDMTCIAGQYGGFTFNKPAYRKVRKFYLDGTDIRVVNAITQQNGFCTGAGMVLGSSLAAPDSSFSASVVIDTATPLDAYIQT